MEKRLGHQLRLLKTCLEAAAKVFGIAFSELARERDLRTFLLDRGDSESSPRQLAADALLELTIGDVRSMDAAVCVAVVDFLDRALGKPPSDKGRQRLRDLRDLVQNARTKRQLMQWIAAWYPD